MTDDEIIKALECCSKDGMLNCRNCPYEESCNMGRNDIQKDALDLINRQKAEIESLEVSTTICEWRKLFIDNARLVRANEENVFVKAIKEQAIKEFAERLKKELRLLFTNDEFLCRAEYKVIDKLVKEMTEEQQC